MSGSIDRAGASYSMEEYISFSSTTSMMAERLSESEFSTQSTDTHDTGSTLVSSSSTTSAEMSPEQMSFHKTRESSHSNNSESPKTSP